MANPFEGLDFSNLFGAAAPAAPEPDPFGRIGAGDPGWESARGAWMSGATLRDLFGDMPLRRRQMDAFGRIDQIMSTGNRPPSVCAAEIVLAEMRKARAPG